MKKTVSILLCMVLVVSLVACGKSEPQTEVTVQEVYSSENTTEQPATEDVEPEQEKKVDEYSQEYYLEQAKELGIADASYYDLLMGNMSYSQFLTMLKNAHDLQYGKDSNCFIDGWLYSVTEGENQGICNEPIPLGQIIDITAMADAVYFRGIERDFTQDFWGSMEGLWEEADLPKCEEYLWEAQHMPIGLDQEGCITADPAKLIYNPEDSWTYASMPTVAYMCAKFDRVSYDYLYTLPEDHYFPENDIMMLRDGIEFVFHYYRSLYPKPEYVSIADVGTYDTTIITDELLNKETSLPKASNQKIPGEWHGISYDYQDRTWGALNGHSDWFINERDFQQIHDSGFNMIKIWTSWYHLLSPYMNTKNQVRLDEETKNRTDVVNLKELEYWDQILAWAMEYDIHVQISFQDTPGLDISVFESGFDAWFDTGYCTNEIFTNEEVQQASADWWRMLSKRYAKIPNTYLSFNMICEPDPESDEIYAKALKPSIDAIWEECPERLIVCDVETHTQVTGEEVAKLGCALACHEYIPHEFCEVHVEKAIEDPSYYTSMTWPYVDEEGNAIDAEATKDIVAYQVSSYNVIKQTAEKYGVGFMVNEFGYFQWGFWEEQNWNPKTDGNFPIQSTEVYQTFLRDKIDGYGRDDVAWVVGAWTGMYADTYTWPIEGADWYEPENYHYVFNCKMLDFWKEINGVQ